MSTNVDAMEKVTYKLFKDIVNYDHMRFFEVLGYLQKKIKEYNANESYFRTGTVFEYYISNQLNFEHAYDKSYDIFDTTNNLIGETKFNTHKEKYNVIMDKKSKFNHEYIMTSSANENRKELWNWLMLCCHVYTEKTSTIFLSVFTPKCKKYYSKKNKGRQTQSIDQNLHTGNIRYNSKSRQCKKDADDCSPIFFESVDCGFNMYNYLNEKKILNTLYKTLVYDSINNVCCFIEDVALELERVRS